VKGSSGRLCGGVLVVIMGLTGAGFVFLLLEELVSLLAGRNSGSS
jgi:hypothetical protein